MLLRSAKDYAIRRWLELDAESALAAAGRNLHEEFGQSGFTRDLFRVWLDLNVDSAVSAWKRAGPALARLVRPFFLVSLAVKDGHRALTECRASRSLVGNQWDFSENEVLEVWARHDPRAAAEMGNGRKAGGLRENPRFSTMREWAESDPVELLHWAESQPSSGRTVQEAFRAAAKELAYADPDRAREILLRVQTLPGERKELSRSESRQIDHAWREVFASEAARDVTRAGELAMSQPLEVRRSALHGYFTYVFAADPEAALSQCKKWIRDPAAKDTVLLAFADSFRWGPGSGARDPSAVLAAIPEFADRIDADVLSGWAKTNPRGAAEWLAQRTASGHPLQDLKKEGIIADFSISEPVWTSAWVRGLTDSSLQNEAAETLTANWGAFDPDAARQWVESLPKGALRIAAETGFNRRNRE
jgi:hypothetical protein